MNYKISDRMLSRHVVESEEELTLAFGPEWASECPYETLDSVRPKFDSVGAMILWQWSLGSLQDEDCGDAQYGNGWHALFRSDRAVLHTNSAGFVSAWRVEDGKDLDAAWEEIKAGAVYLDDVK